MFEVNKKRLSIVGLLLMALSPVLAEDYDVDWWTIDGGGEMRTASADYELSGTIGQSDAAVMCGGAVELVGGFWPVVEHLPGDLNGDCRVDLGDLAQLLANYGTPSGAVYEDGDIDGDGDVDLSDLGVLLSRYGTSC